MRRRGWPTQQAGTAAVGRNRTNDTDSVVAGLLLDELRLLGTSRIASCLNVLAAWLDAQEMFRSADAEH